MATYTVSTSQNYTEINGGVFNDYDRITIDSGATVTINTNTSVIERLVCVTLGRLYVENTSNTTPIFIRTGENSATSLAQLRFEGGGIFEAKGDWIELGTSDGTSLQSFVLPQNINAEFISELPTVFVFKQGETEPEIYNRVSSFTDCFGNEKLGSVFVHDTGTNNIIFGDGFNGCILPNNAVVKIPNIFFFDETTGTGYTDFDLNTSGKLDIDIASFGQGFAFNFDGASFLSVKNCGFDFAREDMRCSTQQRPLFENVGIQMQTGSHQVNTSGSNNIIMLNVFVYNIETTEQYHGLYIVAGAGGTIYRCRVVAPYVPSSSFRCGFYVTSSRVDFEECYVASSAVGWYFAGGSGDADVIDCGFNGAGRRNPTAYATYAVLSANCSDILIQKLNSYPLLELEGAVAPNTYFISLSTGTSDFTVNDCDMYVGTTSSDSRTNNPVYSNGANHRVNNIRIHGDFSSATVNHAASSVNLTAKNITFMNPMANVSSAEWTDGGLYDLVAIPNTILSAPSAAGKDVKSLHCYVSNDKTRGRLFKPMGSYSEGSEDYTEVSISGNVIFNNAGAMYMDTSGDIVEFQTAVHGGITAFMGTALRGAGTQNFSIQFALRRPQGAYGAFTDLTTINLQAALAALTGYDSNEGIQIKYRVTRLASNVTEYLNHIRVDTTIDPNYVAPFEVFPTKVTFKGLTGGDVIYVQDASNNEKLFTISTGADYDFELPNANDGETWVYVVKRAGYEYQKGVIVINAGTDLVVNVVLNQKVQAVGGPMFTDSSNSNVTVDFDLAKPQLSVDVGNSSVSAQNVFDEVEKALVTNNGMAWLAQQGTDINFVNLGGAGSFLFFKDNIRVRRRQSIDENAEISAYVFSTDGTSTDETNGTVKLFSGTLVNDFLQADFDDTDGQSITVAQVFSIIAQLVEFNGMGYRFKALALENTPTNGPSITAQDVWEYDISGSTTNGQAGKELSKIDNIDTTVSQNQTAILAANENILPGA